MSEISFQAAAYLDRKLVVDAWANMADQPTMRPVAGDTLFNAASCAKAIVATCIHQLTDRVMLDYGTPIAHYWQQFAARGKELVTIRHALIHQAGIPQMPSLCFSVISWIAR